MLTTTSSRSSSSLHYHERVKVNDPANKIFNTFYNILDEFYYFGELVHSPKVIKLKNGEATVSFSVGADWKEDEEFEINFFALTSEIHAQIFYLRRLGPSPNAVANAYRGQLQHDLLSFGLEVEQVEVEPIRRNEDTITLSVLYKSDSVMSREKRTIKKTKVIQLPVGDNDYLL